jgi:hypothetical protein
LDGSGGAGDKVTNLRPFGRDSDARHLLVGGADVGFKVLPLLRRNALVRDSVRETKGKLKMSSAQLQPGLIQATQFTVGGYQFGITYETTSRTGTPQFSFTYQAQTWNFVGKEIHVEQTKLGRLVTVSLSSKTNQVIGFLGNNPGNQGLFGNDTESQDELIERLTLLVPTVNLAPDQMRSPVQILAIFSVRLRTGATLGQSQYAMPLSLYGTASKHVF